ncbi:alpha/beta fold hydrolase [Nonomuraea sp. SYSU D8015]|uniref:alpha/beta fold hydrolase n=1 Tax=Nonomuraea sp. SYSU D8015 TaxID=2593644 RepID=UPI001660EE64|nr:alpha/beta hydrolase [Nonomuraea sp. SYSU D8015]
MKRFLGLLVVVLGVVSMTSPTAASAKPTAAGGAKPTVVLVHGAFADASSWSGVIGRLQRAGYPVKAPANPLRGLASDASYLRSVLNTVTGPVVLVGHSYGGAVITNAAKDDPDVKALVFVAAYAPDEGEATIQAASQFEGSLLVPDNLDAAHYPLPGGGEGTDISIKPGVFREAFAADLPLSLTKVMAASQRPLELGALSEVTAGAAWHDVPSWFVVARADNAIPAAAQRFAAKRMKAQTIEVSASHAVAVSRPDAVAEVIGRAAKAVR